MLKKVGFASFFVLMGSILQFKFELIQGTVDLENKLFHKESYKSEIQFVKLDKAGGLLILKSRIKFFYGKGYEIKLAIPEDYVVLNQSPLRLEDPKAYNIYDLKGLKRKYRDLCGYHELFIYPKKASLENKLLIIFYYKLGKKIHVSNDYMIQTIQGKIRLIKNF